MDNRQAYLNSVNINVSTNNATDSFAAPPLVQVRSSPLGIQDPPLLTPQKGHERPGGEQDGPVQEVSLASSLGNIYFMSIYFMSILFSNFNIRNINESN